MLYNIFTSSYTTYTIQAHYLYCDTIVCKANTARAISALFIKAIDACGI